MSSAQPARRQQGPAWLTDYVGVDECLAEFRKDHKDARILTQRLEGEPLTFRAEIYLADNQTTIPNATAHAAVDGGSGNRKQSPTEKTESAAIRRALWVLGYGGREDEGDERPAQMTRTLASSMQMPDGDMDEDDEHQQMDDRIRQVFVSKGHTIEQLRPMINKRYEVTDGLNSLSLEDKKALLEKLRQS